MKRWPLAASFVLFIALCVSVGYWGVQFFKPPELAVPVPTQLNQPAPRLDAAAALFGGHPTAAVSSNFQLKGVVVSSDPAESVAILTTDGKPARAIRTSREVMPGITVNEVQRDHVLLSKGGAIIRVELTAKTIQKTEVENLTGSRSAGVRPANNPNPAQRIKPERFKPDRLKKGKPSSFNRSGIREANGKAR
jgi:general secretion pathway protein C